MLGICPTPYGGWAMGGFGNRKSDPEMGTLTCHIRYVLARARVCECGDGRRACVGCMAEMKTCCESSDSPAHGGMRTAKNMQTIRMPPIPSLCRVNQDRVGSSSLCADARDIVLVPPQRAQPRSAGLLPAGTGSAVLARPRTPYTSGSVVDR